MSDDSPLRAISLFKDLPDAKLAANGRAVERGMVRRIDRVAID